MRPPTGWTRPSPACSPPGSEPPTSAARASATVSTSEMGDAIVTELAQQATESVTDEEN